MVTKKGNGILFACEDEDFGEKYTRSSFKFKYGGFLNSNIYKAYWDAYEKGELQPIPKYTGKTPTEETYSLEDSIKLVHCMNCDKILINNAYRYCNCEYKTKAMEM